ncbi:MAG TPA: PAS domain-containing sensor histidine kinase [Oculatellaceae cyanobacterium]
MSNLTSNLKLTHKAAIVFGTMLVFELLFVGVLWAQLETANRQIDEGNRVRTLVQHLTKLSTLVQYVSMEMFHSLMWSSPGSVDYSWTSAAYERLPNEIRQLKTWARGTEEIAPINELQRICNAEDIVTTFQAAENTYLSQNRPEHLKYLNRLKARSDEAIRQLNSILSYYQEKEEKSEKREQESRNSIKTVLTIGIPANVLVASLIVILFFRGMIRRLGLLSDNTIRVAQGIPLNPTLIGSDEISAVDQSFHRMADALAAAKRREKAIVDNALDVLCSVNNNGTFVEVSPACIALWGYRPDELVGRAFVDILEAGYTDQPIGSRVSEPVKITFENRVLKKDGSTMDMLWSAQGLPHERSWYCVAHDITDRKRAEQLKREFVSMISHDLRTPLNSVEFSLSLISEGVCGEVSEKVSENVSDAENNLAYVMTLIEGLLDVEKMHAGKLEMKFYPTNVDDIVRRAVAAVQPLAERDSSKLTIEHLDADVVADENRLVQVVVNFISNAMKFSPKGTEVKVVARDLVDKIEVGVTDSGPGIPIDQQERIFKRFERIEGNGKPSVEGSGLGLAICKAIVEQHNGTIGVQSDGIAGSTFFFRIPKEQLTANKKKVHS